MTQVVAVADEIAQRGHDTSRWIYLGQDHLSCYIEIPHGLYGVVLLAKTKIEDSMMWLQSKYIVAELMELIF